MSGVLSGLANHAAWQLPVARWLAWDSRSQDAAPDIGFIEPLLRRRLSPLARAALHVANACAAGRDAVSLVYASRHGELGRTVELLRNLARDEALSPTTFSLSVLNSAAGVFAIARGDPSPATAVAAGRESFGFGLVEAYARHQLTPNAPILYVYADAPAPAPLGRQTGDPEGILAFAMLIEAGAPDVLELQWTPDDGPADAAPQALACMEALGGGNGRWASGTRLWHWRKP